MGEAQRRKLAAYSGKGPLPGGPSRCPRCYGLRVRTFDTPESMKFYGRKVTICADCTCAWQPLDESLIWDPTDPVCSMKEPCDDCAFRPGSPEQQNTVEWKKLIDSLKAGGTFYCHKGVPITPESEHGFAYPGDRRDLRICRGYLNALGKWWGL